MDSSSPGKLSGDVFDDIPVGRIRPQTPPPAVVSPGNRNHKRRRRPDLSLSLPQRDTSLAAPLCLPPSSAAASSTLLQGDIPVLDRINRIGSGSGGTVYKVLHRPSGKLYALKVIRGNHEDSVRRLIWREIDILRGLDHPNVVKCHDIFHHSGEIQVLLEYMDGGSLSETLIHDEPSLSDFSRQILSGLEYLHRRKIVHRDIRPSNLLINSRKQVKIADFGVSKILSQTMDTCKSSIGSIAYMSPERIDIDLSHGQMYDGYLGDIWSLGVSILEFYLGRLPFAAGREGDWASLMCEICLSQPPEAPPTASREFRDFISRCLQRDPVKRWTAAQLLRHPFIQNPGGGTADKRNLQMSSTGEAEHSTVSTLRTADEAMESDADVMSELGIDISDDDSQISMEYDGRLRHTAMDKNVTGEDEVQSMEYIFEIIDEGARATFLQNIVHSFGCTYICLWSYLPQPSNWLISMDGFYNEENIKQPSSSSGGYAQMLFNHYQQSVLTLENHDRVPGLAFKNNLPYMELKGMELQRLASIETQLEFYREAMIKTAVFMGCMTGEIEMGFSTDTIQVMNLEMEMRKWITENFPKQPFLDHLARPRPPDHQPGPSSSSSSLRSLATDSTDPSPFLFSINPSTSYPQEPPKQHPITIEQTSTTTSSLLLSPLHQAIHSFNQTRNNFPFLNPETEDDAITKAISAVLSSSSSPSTSPPSSQQSIAQNIPFIISREAGSSAFKRYGSAGTTSSAHSSSSPLIMARVRRPSMLKRAISYVKSMSSLRNQERVVLQGSRPTSNQLYHMISERKRREKLNESFQALRSLLPPGTKYVNAEVSRPQKRHRKQLLGASLGLKDDKQGLEQEVVGQRNFCSPALLGKYAVEQIQGMTELQEKGRVFKGISDHESTIGTAPEGGVLSMEEVVQLNEMGEAVKKGLKLSPEGKESLTRVTDEVSHLSEEELLEEISLEKLDKAHSVPEELEELDCDPVEIPPTISHHFSILRELDLSYTDIKCLPQSISRLVALQKLSLRSCELLMELPPEIGGLTNLEVLDLEQTEIRFLPKEIAKLVNLTCLKVSFYGYANQTVIPRRVLPNLSRLNKLIIDVTPYGEWWDVEVEAIIDDLCSLKELRTLKLYLPTAELLEDLTLIFPGLANFRFTLGRHEEHFISCLPHALEEEFNNWEKLEKGLKYVNGNCIPNEITKVFKHSNAFFLQRHWTAESLSEFGHENMNAVKFCLVMECNEFRTIIDSKQFYQGKDGSSESGDFQDFENAIVLASLEKLIILYMKNVESIWKGPVGTGSLSILKSLALHTCPSLTTLFTIDMLSNLRNLEELIVEDCPKLDSLVSLKSSSSKLGCFLPSLKKISLLELPELASVSSGLFIAPKLERMVVFYCPKLEKLSTMDVSSTNLKVIKGEKEWWEALKWYESDLSTEHEDFLARLFIPLRRDGDLMAQLTKD